VEEKQTMPVAQSGAGRENLKESRGRQNVSNPCRRGDNDPQVRQGKEKVSQCEPPSDEVTGKIGREGKTGINTTPQKKK